MECLKCGREVPAGKVFCRECLEDMERYPVKPGTPIRIPKRQEAAPSKKQVFRRTPATPEIQVKRLKRQLRILSLLLALLLALTGAVVWRDMRNTVVVVDNGPLPGQNYSSMTGTTPTEPT